MASRNGWLHGEMEKWTEEGVISTEQRDVLQARYPVTAEEANRGSLVSTLLMAFAGALVGLGILLFVASNWEEMSNVVKVALIFLLLIVAYAGGWKAYQSVREALGTGLSLLGTLTFGAGVFLIGQMYHIVAYNAFAILIWAGSTLAVAYITRSQIIFVAGLLELLVYDLLQSFSYNQSDYFFFPLMLLAVLFLLKRARHKATLLLYILVLTGGVLRFLGENDLILFGLPIYMLLLYLVGTLVRRKAEPQGIWLQLVGIRLSTLIVFLDLATHGAITRSVVADGRWVMQTGWLFVLLLAATLFVVYRTRPLREGFDVLYFIPLTITALLPTGSLPVPSGILLAIAAIIWILQGGKGERYRLNNGSLFFIVAILGLYLTVALDLLGGAAGFLIGGIILFIVATLVEMSRRSAIKQQKGK